MLKRALKRTTSRLDLGIAARLEAANAQTGIETPLLRFIGVGNVGLEAANAQTGIETIECAVTGALAPVNIRSSECSNGH